jgi:predicted ATPase/class 3 adenylate cyclase
VVELPSGTVTFLFTDLEGSTRLWEQHPEAMKEAMARHDEILRAMIAAHDGYVVKMTGDGAHGAFADAARAVRAAVDAQCALVVEEWGAPEGLRVRMGIHSGHAEVRDGDYFGTAVNKAARLMAVGHGGQIICSQSTADLARDALPEDVGFLDLGEHRLRDLGRAERVFQVNAPELPGEFPPLASVDAFLGNLPLQASSFIGREREIARTIDALRDSRAVTLTGVGGVGKTRLALQVAAEVLPRFQFGAWLCELAPVRSTEGVLEAVANVFDVAARSGQTLEQALVDFLRHKELLLVLDNCEHVLDEAASLVETCERSCPRVRVLATSREGLGIDGERILAVLSLSAPRAGASAGEVAGSDSGRLFVERAQAWGAEVEVTAENAGAIGDICRRLDGVPLAIELAAARAPVINPRELAARLDRRFQVLAGGRRGKVERHQTLRAVIDWSYDLLIDTEQRLLDRVTVFHGGWTLEAAEAVCAGGAVDGSDVFELTEHLVARSLVIAEDHGFQTRYRLLETIRQYGEERLAEHGETEDFRARHADYYVEFMRVTAEEYLGRDQIDAGKRLSAEHENVLAAFAHAIDRDDTDLALRIVRNAPQTGWGVGYPVSLPVEPILGLTGASEHPLYPYGLAWVANQTALRGDREEAESLCGAALDAAERLGSDPDHVIDEFVAASRSAIAYSAGATREAATHAEHGVAFARAAGRLTAVAFGLSAAATYYAMAGEADAAVPLATQGLNLARQLGVPIGIGMNLAALAGALADSDSARARALLRESVELRASLDYEVWSETTQAVLISARLGDWSLTRTLAPPAIRVLHWTRDRPLLGATFNILARVLAPTDPESAAILQGAARRLVTVGAAPPAQSAPGDDSGSIRFAPGPDPTDFVTQLRRATTGLLKDVLGDRRLRELRAEGDALDYDHAVAYALDAITRAFERGATDE